MLEEIVIENLLIIDSVQVGLDPGLNVISGETGVGKSLLLSAVARLFGAKIESGESELGTTRIEGLFRLREDDRARVPEDLIAEGDDLVIRTLKKPGGSQRCYVNGSLVSRKELQALGGNLVDVHGQRDLQRLLSEREQVAVLDLYAGTVALAADFARVFREFGKATELVKNRIDVERDMQDRLGLLHFQRAELQAAEVNPGEHEKLGREHKMLRQARETVVALSSAVDALDGEEDGFTTRIGRILPGLERLAEDDDELREAVGRLAEVEVAAGEAAREMHALAESRSRLDTDPAELESRLNVLNELMRKYRTDESGLVGKLDDVSEEIERLEAELSALHSADDRVAELAEELRRIGGELARQRDKAGKKLSKQVEKELEALRMPHAKFRVDPGKSEPGDDEGDVSTLGFGRPRFLIRTNPGSAFSDLEQCASGGELSRILLALKCVLARTHSMPLMIFDEIETGVGPRLGSVLGERLARLGRHRQVLCITHLPQIAAHADHHLRIEKVVKKGTTRAQITELEGDDRVNEIAAMLGGNDEQLALAQARKLLDEAGDADVAEGAA